MEVERIVAGIVSAAHDGNCPRTFREVHFLEKRAFVSALKRSLELLRKNWWKLLLMAAVLWLLRYPLGGLLYNIRIVFDVLHLLLSPDVHFAASCETHLEH